MENYLPWITAGCSVAALMACVLFIFFQKRGRIATEDLLLELLQQELSDQSEEALRRNSEMRRELNETLRASSMNLTESVRVIGDLQADRIERLEKRSGDLNAAVDKRLESVRADLSELRRENALQLEKIREGVEERLQETLNKRLGSSFSLVQQQLEAVQKGLGEMRTLAGSVGDLRRVMANIKVRGTWGEVQLRAILEQILTPEQYAANVAVRPGSQERVEFAVKLPGDERPVWLPIDSKFPLEDYHRLCAASEAGDEKAMSAARAVLFRVLESEARDVHDKYIVPPYSTDFALIFLPVEGLYAEVLRDPDCAERLQRKYRVVVAGPATLGALLNSLRMGFRTLAIQQRTGEVWELLASVRNEFLKFGETLEKAHRQLSAAATSIEETGRRTRALRRRLDAVEQLGAENADAGTAKTKTTAIDKL
ncbi:MAG: DNA recombination protein RmuC [Pyramidobacter sp.]|jgi:DNA recombination protein RmuC